MKKILLILFSVVIMSAQMKFTEPKPSFENPRKWVIKLNTADEKIVNHTLGAIYNVLKIYPDEAIQISVVTYSSGLRVLKKDYDKHTQDRILSLMDYEVEFVACKNTMETMHWKKSDFIDNLKYVQAGIAEVIEKEAAGWIEVTPY